MISTIALLNSQNFKFYIQRVKVQSRAITIKIMYINNTHGTRSDRVQLMK